MTTLVDICDGLQTELRKLIVKINPSARGSERWTPRDPAQQGNIRETTGRPRTFWLEPGKPVSVYFGSSVRRYNLDWSLVIGYPAEGWDIAAISDLDDLRAAVNLNGGYSTIAGVGYRVIKGEGAWSSERTPQWLWVTVTISSVVETSTTPVALPNYQTKSVQTVTVVGSPVTMQSITATRDGAALWAYHAIYSDTKASRAGLVHVAWDISGATATYYDESTDDIVEAGAGVADTTALSFAASVSGSTVSLTASSSSGTWTVRTTELSRSDET